MEVDCKFLNFGVNIAKALKLHGLKVNFPLKKAFCARMGKKPAWGRSWLDLIN
jgi:hypothetical protein